MTTDAFDQATQPPSLRKRLSDAMAIIGGLRKDKKNLHGKYEYLSEEAVKRAAQDAFVTAQVVPEFSFSILAVREVKASNGGTRLLYDVLCTVTIRDGDETVTSQGLGSGIDHTDKGLMKAQTAALRECLKGLFCIPSGTDPEAYPDEPHGSDEAKPAAKPGTEQKQQAPVSLEALSSIRKELGMSSAQVSAVAVKRFGKKVGAMDQAGIDALWAFLGQLQPEVHEEILNDDLSNVQKAGGPDGK